MKYMVYIAGASAEAERCRYWMDRARNAGVDLSLDWLLMIEEKGANEDLDEPDRKPAASECLDAIDFATIVWVLAPERETQSIGPWVEMGYALATHKRVIVSGDTKRSIFCALADEFPNDAAAFSGLCALVGVEG